MEFEGEGKMYFLVGRILGFGVWTTLLLHPLTILPSCHDFQDLQKGLDLGLVSPEVLQNFFDLEKYPLISELTHRFQVSLNLKTKATKVL